MGDVAKGIKSFKKGMSSDDTNQTNLEDKKTKIHFKTNNYQCHKSDGLNY